MAILGFELEEIVRLLQMLEESDLDEIVIKEEDRFLRIRGPRRARAVAAAPSVVDSPAPVLSKTPPALPAKPDTPAMAAAEDEIVLTSPMMGMFYRSEKPGAPSMVNIGQTISVGQTIGIIEAMKIFSEVPAEHAGVVVAIPAQDGQLVQLGTPLVILRKV